MKMYICPVAKECVSYLNSVGLISQCGCRLPHERVKSKNHDHREWNCSEIKSKVGYCPACEPIDEKFDLGIFLEEYGDRYEAYLQDISSRVGQVPPDKLY